MDRSERYSFQLAYVYAYIPFSFDFKIRLTDKWIVLILSVRQTDNIHCIVSVMQMVSITHKQSTQQTN